MRPKPCLRAVFVGWAIAALLALSAPAIELKPDTSAAFDAYVRATEARMDDDLRQDHFLAVDDLPDARRQETYAQLAGGRSISRSVILWRTGSRFMSLAV